MDVNVNEKTLHVFRDPTERGFRTVFAAKAGERVTCAALTQIVIEAGELFGV